MKLALLGCGLLGGSTAAAWRRSGLAGYACGYDLDPAAARAGVSAQILDQAAPDVASAVRGADLILLASPVGAMAQLLAEVALHAPAEAVITDVGSTKGSVVQAARAALGARMGRFVPAHPVAGSERPGIQHADARLFEGRRVITTPLSETEPPALARVEELWRASGAIVERLEVEEHDRIFAAVSHLPHLLSFALVDAISGREGGEKELHYAGAGFRDFSRIAASDPVMWRDVCLANAGPLGDVLEEYRALLSALQQAIATGDAQSLQDLFSRAASVRRAHTFAGGPE